MYISKSSKKMTDIPEDTVTVNCRKEEITMLTSTTFVVFHIKTQDRDFFLKEVKLCSNFKKYIYECIETYFYFTEQNPTTGKAKDVVLKSLSRKQNLKKLLKMGNMTDEDSNISKFLKTNDGTIIGVEYDTSEDELNRQIIHLVKEYLQSYVLLYNYRKKNGTFINYFSSRQISYKKLADMLGIGNMVPETEYVRLKIDGNTELFGVATDKAEGISAADIGNCIEAVTPKLVRSLENLNLLDCICLEKDHAKDNLFYPIDEKGKIKSAVAFDNCSFNSFFINGNVHFRSYYQSAYYIERNKINRPHMDKQTAELLNAVSYSGLKKELSPYLPKLNIVFVYLRIKKIKSAIKNTVESNRDFLLDEENWTEEIMKEYTESDLCGTYIREFMYCPI